MSVSCYRFETNRAGVWYQISAVAVLPLAIVSVVLGFQRLYFWAVPLLALAATAAVVNQVLFARSARAGGGAFTMRNGVATRAGRACWQAATAQRRV